MSDTNTKNRHIPAQYDNRGNPTWTSRMSAPDNSVGICNMVPDRVIPVIFVPGVMGSNLIEKGVDPKKAIKWRLDTTMTAVDWASPKRGAAFRKRYLRPDVMEVDREGKVPADMALPIEELRRRGWGEVGAISYSEFLVWLENALGDFDNCQDGERVGLMAMNLQAMTGEACPTREEIGLSYRFPVYACGYNWLDSNANSAKRLGQRVDEVIARYRKDKKKVEKVIIVTHSMGGLVARHCSEIGGYRDKILGIVHGVMPAIGAAATYRRMKAGTENPGKGFHWIEGTIAAEALGADAAEMTAVLSGAPGPLQLLPTPEYGNGWLKLKDGAKEYAYPENGDPYGDIYTKRGKWWSLCDESLINPLNDERDSGKRQAKTENDWKLFERLIRKHVKVFHDEIEQKYHPNTHAFFGSHSDNRAYGAVTWQNHWAAPAGHGQRPLGRGLSQRESGADVPNGQGYPGEINDTRTVNVSVEGGVLRHETRSYRISEPEENGDGTVPHRSGMAPQKHCKSFLQVNVAHEPAYKFSKSDDNRRACRFTLRAIVQIAQDVQQTSLRYD